MVRKVCVIDLAQLKVPFSLAFVTHLRKDVISLKVIGGEVNSKETSKFLGYELQSVSNKKFQCKHKEF